MMAPALSKEGFERYIQRHIDEGIAFTAYWHSRGYGLLVTGPRPRTKHRYILHVPGKPDKEFADHQACRNRVQLTKGAWMETIEIADKPKQVPESRVKQWRKLNDAYRRRCWGEYITVEYDGTSVAVEGGELHL